MSNSLPTHGLYSPWNSPGQNTGVGKPLSSPGILPNPGIKPKSPASQADSLPAEPQGNPLSHRLSGLKQHTSVLSSEIQNGSHWVKSSLPLGEPNKGYNFLHLSISKGCQNSLSCGPHPSLKPDWPINSSSRCTLPISAPAVMSLTDSSAVLFHIERPLWLRWINSRSSPYLQVSWLAISILSATLTSLHQ